MAVSLTEALRRITTKEKEIREEFQRVSKKIAKPGFSPYLHKHKYETLHRAVLGSHIKVLAKFKKTLRDTHKKAKTGDARAQRKLKKMLKDFQ